MSANIFDDVRGCDKGYNRASRACYNCGNRDHLRKCCPELRCYYCGRWGHTRKVCLFRLADIMLRNHNLERRNIESGSNKVAEERPMNTFNACKEKMEAQTNEIKKIVSKAGQNLINADENLRILEDLLNEAESNS